MYYDKILEGIQRQTPNLKSQIGDTKGALSLNVSIGTAGVQIVFQDSRATINHLPVRADDPANEVTWDSEQGVIDYVVQYFARKTETLPHTADKVGHKCGVCRQEIRKMFVGRGMEDDIVCSEFCAEVRKEELQEFRDASPGTGCIYPCPGCGKPMDDAWHPDRKMCRCSDCANSDTLNARTQALRKCRDVLESEVFKLEIWDKLRAEIDAALED